MAFAGARVACRPPVRSKFLDPIQFFGSIVLDPTVWTRVSYKEDAHRPAQRTRLSTLADDTRLHWLT